MPENEGVVGLPAATTSWVPTLLELRARVRSNLRDSEASFISPGDVDAWLNDGYLDLCARLRLVQKSVTGTTTSTGTIALPSDFIEPISLAIASVVPIWVGHGLLTSWKVPDIDPESMIVRIFGANIETWPVQKSKSYTLEYSAQPVKMTSPSDTPSSLPGELVIRIIHYAVAQAKKNEGEAQEAQDYMDLYEAGLPDAPRATFRLNPGPDSFSPAPSYWDLDTAADA